MLEARSTEKSLGRGVFIQKSGGKVRIDIRGNVQDSTIRALKQKYPDAKISAEADGKGSSKQTLTAVERMEKFGKRKGRSEETGPEKLALKRFREKRKEKQREDPASKEGEDR